MFDVSDDLLTMLRSRSRDLIYVYEIYAWNYVVFTGDSGLSFDPRLALERFAGQNISFGMGSGPVSYRREVPEDTAFTINKTKEKKFDSISITFSNVSRYMAAFVLNNRIQGMRLVVRMISLSATGIGDAGALADSVVVFAGRIEKPDDFNRKSGTISAKQDLGTIQAQIPERDFQPTCPLDFKKGDCLGDQTLAQKTLTFQAGVFCNKTKAHCIHFGNEKYFQGAHIVQITSSFVNKSHRGLLGKILAYGGFGLIGTLLSRRKKTTVGNSIFDGTPYGTPISIILGRWKKALTTLQYQDLGNTINFKDAVCRGKIRDILAIRNNAPNFSQPGSIIKHLGEFGGVGTQTQDLLFPGGEYHSRLAYITGSCTGSDIIVEDPAPDNEAVIAGAEVRTCGGLSSTGAARVNSSFAGYTLGDNDFSDNPVDQAVYVITQFLGLPLANIAEKETARTSAYTLGAIKDLSNGERCLLPNTETANAGVQYKRYQSTGVNSGLSYHYNDGVNFLPPAQKPGGVYLREAHYEFFDPASPPTSLDVIPVYRKRFSSNIEINEKKKAIDFLYDTLYTTFRGFNRWDQHGRLVVDSERPADHSFLRANASAGQTSIKVLDVTPWKPFDLILNQPSPLRGKLLIGAHKKLTSEVRPPFDTEIFSDAATEYSSDGDSITLEASATGSLSVTVSGPTLSGGSSSTPSEGSVAILGTPVVGDTVTIVIDGFEISLTVEGPDTNPAIPDALIFGQRMCFAINAEPILKEYVEASIGSAIDVEIFIKSKYGVLNFSTPLEEDHFAEIADPVDPPSVSTSAGALDAGAYLLSYAYRNANGNTNISPILAITLTSDKQIDVDAVSLPSGADSIDWFVSVEANSDVRLLVHNNDGSAFSINALPVVTAAQEPKRNTTGEEILRVMMSFAGKALTYADTSRANVLDGSFGWPEAGRQSTINQVRGKYRNAIWDFAEQPIVVNDERHQEDTGEINAVDIDISAVDNYWQAQYLLNGYLAKYRDLDFFFKHSSAGEALLLEVNDLICVSDDSGGWRNVPVTIEDIALNQRHEVSFINRLYSTTAFDEEVLETEVPLPSDLPQVFAGPPAPTALTLNHVETSGTFDSRITGTITLGAFRGQQARIYVTPPGGTEVLAQTLEPGETEFSVPAPASGDYTVRVVMVSLFGVVGGEISDTINVFNSAATTLFANGDLVQLALGIAQQARALAGTDQTARDSAHSARDIALAALGIAEHARAIAGAASSSTDQAARDTASQALLIAQSALGIAQQARALSHATASAATDVLTVQGFM